jgi:ribosomal RNA-processing protein 8
MPPFFDVPGWTVPNEPISASKKRKRPRASAANGTDDADQIASASINVDKLIRSLDTVLAAEGKAGKIKGKIPAVLLGDDEDMPEGSRAGKRNKVDEGKKGKVNKPSDEISSQKMKAHVPTTGKGKTKEATTPGASHQDRSADAATAPASRKKKKEKANTNNPETSTKAAQPSAVSKPDTGSSQMTALQAKMKNSLDGARFRYDLHGLP